MTSVNPASSNPLNDVMVKLPPGTSTKTDTTQGMNKDTFLKLLVAQLKFQNPQSPTDSTQMLAQTAQFAMVERLENLDKQMTKLANTAEATGAANLLGQKIVATGSNGSDVTGIVTGMRITADGPVIKIGDMEIAYSNVKEVDRPA
jgi:flagellar basal-body rod modification protein FlgD